MLTVNFNLITENTSGNSNLGFLPFAVRFDTIEEARAFLKKRNYSQDPNNEFIMLKNVDNGSERGTAIALISQVTEPEAFFEDELNSPQPGSLS